MLCSSTCFSLLVCQLFIMHLNTSVFLSYFWLHRIKDRTNEHIQLEKEAERWGQKCFQSRWWDGFYRYSCSVLKCISIGTPIYIRLREKKAVVKIEEWSRSKATNRKRKSFPCTNMENRNKVIVYRRIEVNGESKCVRFFVRMQIDFFANSMFVRITRECDGNARDKLKEIVGNY